MDKIKNNNHFDITEIRNDFPVLAQKIYGEPLVYFDNAATTQKPKIVIDTINKLHYGGKRCQEPFLGLPGCLKVISRPNLLIAPLIQPSLP